MSVITTDPYRRAFQRHLLGQSLTADETAVLEQGRREARLPSGRYPLPCEVETTPHRGGDEVAVTRLDTPPPSRMPRGARWNRWADEER